MFMVTGLSNEIFLKGKVMTKEYFGKPFRVPDKYAKAAEKEARSIRKKTGKDMRWTDVIKKALAAYFGF